jgi:serine/threonine protein kinase
MPSSEESDMLSQSLSRIDLNSSDTVTALKEICDKFKGMTPSYGEARREGEAHNPTFFQNCTICYENKYITQEGSGKTKANAKKEAARKVLEKLDEEIRAKRSSYPSNLKFTDVFKNSIEIGRGGNGIVLKCKKDFDSKELAIKLIPFDDAGRAQKEMKILASLTHPNIVTYHTSWIEDRKINEVVILNKAFYTSLAGNKTLCIQMELCKANMEKVILVRNESYRENGVLALKKEDQINSRRFIRHISKGLLYIHSKDVIHRDLKIENVLIDEHMIAKICDFGFVKLDLTKKHTPGAGTHLFMAPEVASGDYDRKCDFYSLGIIFFLIYDLKATTYDEIVLRVELLRKCVETTDEIEMEDFIAKWPKQWELIRNLMKTRPDERMHLENLLTQIKQLTISDQ